VFGEGVGRVFYLFYASGKVDGSDSHVVDRLSIYIYNIYIQYIIYICNWFKFCKQIAIIPKPELRAFGRIPL